MRKFWTILGVVMMAMLLSVGVNAQGTSGTEGMFTPPPWVDTFPKLAPTPWADGQFVTYNTSVNADGEDVNLKLRFAVIGSEQISGADYYWFEIDAYDLTGLPEDEADFTSFKLQLLMKQYDVQDAKDDPQGFMKKIIQGDYLKRIIFQMDDETPMEVDISLIQMMAPMLEMSTQMTMEQKGYDAANMWKDAQWGIETIDISTEAGKFNNATKLWFKMAMDEAATDMEVVFHEDIPLIMLAKIAGTVTEPTSGSEINISCELADSGNDATGWITGEPKLFTMESMGEMMGGSMGGVSGTGD